jgi:4-hydroxybenzoyl-CoA thioesterase
MTGDQMAEPYVHEISVGWGDCDPARIAYTANIPAWALKAIEGWWQAHLDGDGWYQMELDRGWGTPFVHMDMDFRAPVTPRHKLFCEVVPTRLGARSISFHVTGSQDGSPCFNGNFTCAFITAGSLETRPAPPEVRALVEPMLAGGE